MLKKTKSISLSGTSTVQYGGKEVVVLTMNATIREDGSLQEGKIIQHPEAYRSCIKEAKADKTGFDDWVENFLLQEGEETENTMNQEKAE